MREYSKPDALSRLQAAQLAFSRDALVRLVPAFYSILEFAVALGKFFYDFIRTARDITTDRGGKLHNLTDMKFVSGHGGRAPL